MFRRDSNRKEKRISLVVGLLVCAVIFMSQVEVAANSSNSYTIKLNSGWNLISLPLQTEGVSISSVFSGINGSYSQVWSYQNGSWKMYDPQNAGLSDFSIVTHGPGYMIYMKQGGSITITGSSAYSNAVKLSKGWNLVGFSSPQALSVTNALPSVIDKVKVVWSYQSGSWKMYDPKNAGMSDFNTFVPGQGYWIEVSEDCTWELPRFTNLTQDEFSARTGVSLSSDKFKFVGAVTIDKESGDFNDPVNLSLQDTSGLSDNDLILVARVIDDANGDGKADLVLVDVTSPSKLKSVRNVVGRAPGSGLSGITQGGNYVFSKALSPIGFIQGTVVDKNDSTVNEVLIESSPSAGTGVFSDVSGKFILPVPLTSTNSIQRVSIGNFDGTFTAIYRGSQLGQSPLNVSMSYYSTFEWKNPFKLPDYQKPDPDPNCKELPEDKALKTAKKITDLLKNAIKLSAKLTIKDVPMDPEVLNLKKGEVGKVTVNASSLVDPGNTYSPSYSFDFATDPVGDITGTKGSVSCTIDGIKTQVYKVCLETEDANIASLSGDSCSEITFENSKPTFGIRGENKGTTQVKGSALSIGIKTTGKCSVSISYSKDGQNKPCSTEVVIDSQGGPIKIDGQMTFDVTSEMILGVIKPTKITVEDCAFTINPTSKSFKSTGGSDYVAVTVDNADNKVCKWTASSSADWITVKTPSGTGNGTVTYAVSENPNIDKRTGTIVIAEKTFTVTQDGCSCTINPTNKSFKSTGGSDNVGVTADNKVCKWTASSNDGWITVNTPSGTGNGTVAYNVSENTSEKERTGTITIAGQTFTVTQEKKGETGVRNKGKSVSYMIVNVEGVKEGNCHDYSDYTTGVADDCIGVLPVNITWSGTDNVCMSNVGVRIDIGATTGYVSVSGASMSGASQDPYCIPYYSSYAYLGTAFDFDSECIILKIDTNTVASNNTYPTGIYYSRRLGYGTRQIFYGKLDKPHYEFKIMNPKTITGGFGGDYEEILINPIALEISGGYSNPQIGEEKVSTITYSIEEVNDAKKCAQ
ncbi:conserved hypothetical protein, secreted [Candidatus Magnetobacterium bavaricum]|uniref:BACON domain-containing protein n=1 Tax=Candidatus Magnetobacterium bavaricum TaxID=29290 RepID=A0A0F3GSG0_9BACT|nr:conserved hypothetical protein, secreted [Candidatus Magnetobacterium bavaricum]